MAFSDDIFNEYGKIPTDADFWNADADTFSAGEGITRGFSRVIAEQIFAPLSSRRTPWLNRFAGRPITAGSGWVERAVKIPSIKRYNPKATAQDALGFVDTTGVEKVFEVDYEAWVPVSMPSEFSALDEFLASPSGPQRLNDYIYDNAKTTYDLSLDSAIAKKAVSCSTGKVEIEAGYTTADLFDKISDVAMDMMTSGTTGYNELEADEAEGIETRADSVLAFMPAKLWKNIRSDRASLPSPSQIIENVEVVPIYDSALPTPLTTAEFGTQPSTGITWKTKPANIDGKTPIVYLVDPRKIEYRPVMGSYKVNLDINGAGDFTNAHVLGRLAIAVKPWFNACSIVEAGGA